MILKNIPRKKQKIYFFKDKADIMLNRRCICIIKQQNMSIGLNT